jgi:hypothetical protein
MHLAPLLRRMEEATLQRLRSRILGAKGSLGDVRREQLALAALSRAVTDFVAMAGHRDGRHEAAHVLFAEVGKASIKPFAANGVVWSVLSESASAFNLKGSEVVAISAAVSSYLEHVNAAIQAARTERGVQPPSPRADLAQALCSQQPRTAIELDHLSAVAGWPIPEELSVLAVDRTVTGARGWRLPPNLLSTSLGRHEILLADVRDTEMAIQLVRRFDPVCTLALCRGISSTQAAHAARWAVGLKDLERAGRVAAQGNVVSLSDHACNLALQSDVRLGQWVAERTLSPLMTLARQERLDLAETLLFRLTVSESTAVVAEDMAVHAQTVRNRTRKLKGFFGDGLSDQHHRLEMIVALQAMLPMWRLEAMQHRRPRRH